MNENEVISPERSRGLFEDIKNLSVSEVEGMTFNELEELVNKKKEERAMNGEKEFMDIVDLDKTYEEEDDWKKVESAMMTMDELEKTCEENKIPEEGLDPVHKPTEVAAPKLSDEEIQSISDAMLEKKAKNKFDYISNCKCAVSSLRNKEYCNLCKIPCNGFLHSSEIIPIKMVDLNTLCVMNQESPKTMYITKSQIDSFVNGSMAIVTPDGTCLVFAGK